MGPVLQSGGYVYSIAPDPKGEYLSLGADNNKCGDSIDDLTVDPATGSLTAGSFQGGIGACAFPSPYCL